MTWDIAVLESYRHKADPLADAVVAKIIESGEVEHVNQLFRKMVENMSLPMEEMPDYVRDYFLQTAQLPAFADTRLIAIGQQVFATYGPEISMMLLCKALPSSYTCGNGAEVLYATGRLNEQHGDLQPFTRRLMETSQFVIDVLAEKGIEPSGRGIRSAQKVRLMHASIRYFLHQRGDWDYEKLGIPINQEDMAGTLMAFAAYPIEGLGQIGIDLSKEQKEGYFHVWRLIGTVMGVEPDLIPTHFEAGMKLGYAILDHQKRQTQAGIELGKACLDFLKSITPTTLFDFYPQMLVRYLMGDELANIIAVPDFPNYAEKLLQKLTIAIFGKVDKTMDRNGLIAALARHFNTRLLEGMINHFNHEKQINFYIPPSLQENWLPKPLVESWKTQLATPDILGYRLALQKKEKN
ncbi:oxygenase MpaB family protein [Hugenholtzia roseola]|uniref:oxygenase MpaB family protein n=1 Tax=Hugenholtzia roseola TaxID=1002 RepID=UPI00040BE13B|nr:oxygenase MpaB family protein [Hugenholtzia roseola]